MQEIVVRACQEKTLVDALTFAAVIECERAIVQAREFDRTGISTASHGGGWDTSFRVSFVAVMEAWETVAQPAFDAPLV